MEFYCYNINKLINLIRLELFTQPPLAGRSQHESSAPFRMEINSVHTFQPRVPDFNYNPGMHRGNKSGRATHKSATSSPRNPAEIWIFFPPWKRGRNTADAQARVQKSPILILISTSYLNNNSSPSSSILAEMLRHPFGTRREPFSPICIFSPPSFFLSFYFRACRNKSRWYDGAFYARGVSNEWIIYVGVATSFE